MRYLAMVVIFLININAYAQPTLTLTAQEVQTKEALFMLARLLKINIVVNPKVEGVVSLNLKDISAAAAFESVMHTQHLSKIKLKDVWYIAPSAEVLRQQEMQQKIHDALPLNFRVWQVNYAKVETIANLLQDNKYSLISAKGQLHIDPRTNILYVEDKQANLDRLAAFIKRVDIPVKQVLIEAYLASVDYDFESDLGIRYQFISDHFSLQKLGLGLKVGVQLAALEKMGHGEIISSPRLFTANQKTASIEAGEEIPYQEVSRSGGTGVAFKKAVLSLKVTPQILPHHQVLLELQVNQDKPSKRVIMGVPAITTRQLQSQILVKSGQTIVLGGIYEKNTEVEREDVPFLSKIPLIGWLFRQESVTKTKRELLIFITPKIII